MVQGGSGVVIMAISSRGSSLHLYVALLWGFIDKCSHYRGKFERLKQAVLINRSKRCVQLKNNECRPSSRAWVLTNSAQSAVLRTIYFGKPLICPSQSNPPHFDAKTSDRSLRECFSIDTSGLIPYAAFCKKRTFNYLDKIVSVIVPQCGII